MPGPAYPVVIVGAGPVGLALACLLSRQDVPCLVLAAGVPGQAPAADPRALALTPAAHGILERCGAWDRLDAASIGAFERMEVWDANGSGRIQFDSAELGISTLGYIVNQSRLEAALLAALLDLGVMPQPVQALDYLEFHRDHVTVGTGSGAAVKGSVAVGADGARSRLRELAGIPFAALPYGQHALACSVRTQLAHGSVARQRFLAAGPLAFLPLADAHACGVVWSTSPAEARRLQLLDQGLFRAELAQAFEHVLGEVTEVESRVVFPLQRGQAQRYCRSRLVLVGDAAHTIHPLAGQGANLGLLDAATLAELMVQAIAAGRDPGSLRVLRAYERWRAGENALMIAAMDGLQKLFASSSPLLRWLRGTGLDLCNALPPLKCRLIARATGIEGDLPAGVRVPVPGDGLR